MAEAFPVSGNIEPASFPHLLVDLHRHGATGSLKVTGPVHPKALYFRGGRILFGSSNDPRDQLGAILIESGRISREQLDEVNAKVGPGNPLAKVLAESGFVNQRELGDAARVKVERILADVLSWDSGTFEFEDGVLPKGAVDLKLSTERLLLAAVQRVPDRSLRPASRRPLDRARAGARGRGRPLRGAGRGLAAARAARRDPHPEGRHRPHPPRRVRGRQDRLRDAVSRCRAPQGGGGEELDLAEEAQSGFGAEPPPMYTVPVEAIRAASPPASEPTGFAFSEPEPAFPAVEPDLRRRRAGAREPGRDRRASRSPPPEPEPEPFPEVLPAEPTAIPEAPSFTMDAPRPRKVTDTVPGDRPVYVPPPAPAPADEPAAYAPAAPSVPEIAPAPAPASRPTQEDLAALDALLNPSASGQLGKSPVERPRPEKWEPQFRPPTTPPRKAPARPAAASSPSRVPLIAAVARRHRSSRPWRAWYFFLRAPRPRPGPARWRRRARPRRRRRPRWPPPPRPRRPRPSSCRPRPRRRLRCRARRPRPRRSRHHRRRPLRVPRPRRRPRRHRATPRPTPAPVAPAGDARALLAQGALPDAARAFAASLAPGRPRPLHPAGPRGLRAGERPEGRERRAGAGAPRPARGSQGPRLLPPVLGRLRQPPRGRGRARQPAVVLPAGRRLAARSRLSPSSSPERAAPAPPARSPRGSRGNGGGRLRRPHERPGDRGRPGLVRGLGAPLSPERGGLRRPPLARRKGRHRRRERAARGPGHPEQPRAPRRRGPGRGAALRAPGPLPPARVRAGAPGARRGPDRPRPGGARERGRLDRTGPRAGQRAIPRAARGRAGRGRRLRLGPRAVPPVARGGRAAPRAEEARRARRPPPPPSRARGSGSATTAPPTSRSAWPSCACSTPPGRSTSGASGSRRACRSRWCCRRPPPSATPRGRRTGRRPGTTGRSACR